jgi:8-oxo-dGTP pyrophosphatase MutT (NUDIX family)
MTTTRSSRGTTPVGTQAPRDVTHAYAGVFLVTDAGRVIGQRRDDVPGIDNPGRVGPFGGTVDAGEDPQSAAWRELTGEETNLVLPLEDLRLWHTDTMWRSLTEEWEHRHVYFVVIADDRLASMEVYEGAGWAVVADAVDPLLIESYRPIVRTLIDAIGDGTIPTLLAG